MNSIPSSRDASNGPDVKTKFLSLSVDAKVETPSRTYTVPCFFYEPFTRDASGIASAGAPSWRLRILPLENGVHRITIHTKEKSGRAVSPVLAVTVGARNWPGMLRVSAKNPLALEFDKAGAGTLPTAATSQTHPPTTYFVDSQSGRDRHDGRSPDRAWQTLEKVNAADLNPGDTVRFNRGGVWRGSLVPASGDKRGSVTYTAYGQGPKPLILGSRPRHCPEDWVYVEGNIWATLPLHYTAGAPVLDLRRSKWTHHQEQGAKISLTHSDTPAGIVVKVACTTGGTATNHVQVWGPSMPVNRGTHLQHGRHVGHRDQVQRLLRSHRMGQPLLERLENPAHAGRQPLVQRPWRDGKLVRHEDRQLRGVSREDRTRRPLALRPAEIRRRSPRRLPPCPPTAPARAWAPGTPRSASIGSPPTDPKFRSSIRPRITQIQKITENPSRPNPRRIQFPSSKSFAVMQFPSNDTLKVPPCIP